MKKTKTIFLVLLVMTLGSFKNHDSNVNQFQGAWETGGETKKSTRIFSEKYFSVAVYNAKDKQFISTAGGSWRIEGKELVETFEFNTENPALVGKEVRTPFSADSKTLTLNKSEKWARIDDGTPGNLAGAWLITGRMENNEIKRRTPGVRKTMKILSGKRFQWIAYNTETKEFFGTGGGTYSTKDGKYTENIDFFSRDNSRVGASLQFDFSLEQGEWRHKGLSSKGDPIDEIWTKREVLDQ